MSIDFEVDAGIAVITINRPERMNAMDTEHYHLLSEAWQRVRDEPAIRVAIITGAGDRSFTAGADLKSRVGVMPEVSEFWLTQKDLLLNRGLEVWKPIIAAVNGHCLGGGMTLLLATDIRVAATHATFGLSEVKRGVVPANGGTQRVLDQFPRAIGMELLLTGSPIDADAALRWGLVNKVVRAESVMATAREYAETIAANAPLAVQAAKELAIRSRDIDMATGLRLEQAVNRILRGTDDTKEGTTAFAEKRSARFTGR